MKITEMIAYLKVIEAEHGDLEVTDTYGESVEEPEFIDGECVLCDKA